MLVSPFLPLFRTTKDSSSLYYSPNRLPIISIKGLLILLVLYIVGGAELFILLEGPKEEEARMVKHHHHHNTEVFIIILQKGLLGVSKIEI